ncbi:MAG: ankyrin repeat domain-containing protein, partial [Nakamurella sp.]
DPDVPLLDVLSTAEFLLQAGADPNAGFLLPDEATPFTALTGAMGSGELGSNDQPGHPHGPALARLLLTAGADANDGQALYNRMFEPQNDHLQLLFEFGLGAGDGGPWHRRFPSTTDDPSSMLADQLSWAVCHGMAERVRLLAAHGVDLGPLGGRLAATGVGTMIELAQISGHPEIADLLIGVGAPSTHVAPVVQLAAALLAGDAERVRALTESDPTLLPMLRAQRPALVLRAVGTGSAPGVELVLRNGFDINAYGRQDVPIEQPWETALHCAAGAGELELVQLLLRAGADPNLVDKRFGTTPLGWTEHFGRTELTETLRPVTGAPAPS